LLFRIAVILLPYIRFAKAKCPNPFSDSGEVLWFHRRDHHPGYITIVFVAGVKSLPHKGRIRGIGVFPFLERSDLDYKIITAGWYGSRGAGTLHLLRRPGPRGHKSQNLIIGRKVRKILVFVIAIILRVIVIVLRVIAIILWIIVFPVFRGTLGC
jgi:hypothetical protein